MDNSALIAVVSIATAGITTGIRGNDTRFRTGKGYCISVKFHRPATRHRRKNHTNPVRGPGNAGIAGYILLCDIHDPDFCQPFLDAFFISKIKIQNENKLVHSNSPVG